MAAIGNAGEANDPSGAAAPTASATIEGARKS